MLKGTAQSWIFKAGLLQASKGGDGYGGPGLQCPGPAHVQSGRCPPGRALKEKPDRHPTPCLGVALHTEEG